jgi:hypothetical protein
MTRLDPATLFCTDEDLLILAPGDYLKMVPADQVYASADDGVILAGEWSLASATIPFATQGVRAGMACSLEGTAAQLANLASKRADLLVVEAATDDALTLRRKAESAGKGQPPARSDASSLPFRVVSLWPQIEAACYDLRSDYRIDDGAVGRRFVDLVDPRELNQAAALLTLSRLYEALNRGGDDKGDAWAAKAKMWRARYDDLVARSLVHFRRESPGYGGANEAQNGQCRAVR